MITYTLEFTLVESTTDEQDYTTLYYQSQIIEDPRVIEGTVQVLSLESERETNERDC